MSTSSLKYDKSHCKIYLEQDLNCIRLVWNGFSKPDDFQEACNFALDLLVENNASMVIADNRNASVVSKENQAWLAQEWYPMAYAKGFRTSAVIVGDNALNKISIKKIENSRTGGEFTTRHFETLEEAKEWLRTT
ncbi:hypothetical protein [Ekhidna sp.]|uniref:hypothetical protein n=1 Tax=Ekhidna sp. TaxID=2608089 RepID=UPI003299CC25